MALKLATVTEVAYRRSIPGGGIGNGSIYGGGGTFVMPLSAHKSIAVFSYSVAVGVSGGEMAIIINHPNAEGPITTYSEPSIVTDFTTYGGGDYPLAVSPTRVLLLGDNYYGGHARILDVDVDDSLILHPIEPILGLVRVAPVRLSSTRALFFPTFDSYGGGGYSRYVNLITWDSGGTIFNSYAHWTTNPDYIVGNAIGVDETRSVICVVNTLPIYGEPSTHLRVASCPGDLSTFSVGPPAYPSAIGNGAPAFADLGGGYFLLTKNAFYTDNYPGDSLFCVFTVAGNEINIVSELIVPNSRFGGATAADPDSEEVRIIMGDSVNLSQVYAMDGVAVLRFKDDLAVKLELQHGTIKNKTDGGYGYPTYQHLPGYPRFIQGLSGAAEAYPNGASGCMIVEVEGRDFAPPLRQRQRDDGLATSAPRQAGTARNAPTSRQHSIRQGSGNTYW